MSKFVTEELFFCVYKSFSRHWTGSRWRAGVGRISAHCCPSPARITSSGSERVSIFVEWVNKQVRVRLVLIYCVWSSLSVISSQNVGEDRDLKGLSSSCYQKYFSAVAVQLLWCVWFLMTSGTVARQAPLSMEFPRQEYWSGLSCPPPGDLFNPGIKLTSLSFPASAGGFFTTEPPKFQ